MFLALTATAMAFPECVVASENDAGGAPSQAVITVPLTCQEISYPFLFRQVPDDRRSSPFPNEPLFSGHVLRGVLKFGGLPSNAIPFIWQTGANKLYLDLHRDGDFTNPECVFHSYARWAAAGCIQQVFTNVPLCFPATSGGAPVLMDFNLFQDGRGGPLQVRVRA